MDFFLNFICDTLLIVFGLCSLHLALERQSLSLLNRIFFFDLQETFLCDSKLIFQNPVDDLQSALLVDILLTKVVTVAFFDSEVEEGGLLRELIHIIGLLYALETCPKIFFLLTFSLMLLARLGPFAHFVTSFPR